MARGGGLRAGALMRAGPRCGPTPPRYPEVAGTNTQTPPVCTLACKRQQASRPRTGTGGAVTEPATLASALTITQAVIALLLALVFHGFFRIYRRAHLQYWSLSFLAGLLYYLGAGFALALPAGAWRSGAAALSLAAAYPQIVWLLAGAYVA